MYSCWMIDCAAPREMRAIDGTEATLKLFDGMYHEIFNEVRREGVLNVVREWIGERV